MGRKPTGHWGTRAKYKGLSTDQVRFNKIAARKKGKPGSKKFKRYTFGAMTNRRKGR